ncbi:hypothetical protein F5Y05DRAFT_274973 [Hypoxylon sp. FL0543]|nr:hypothetical protein F5Y05DRAFT_274973 [Hypoxylon sp. FL0543]
MEDLEPSYRILSSTDPAEQLFESLHSPFIDETTDTEVLIDIIYRLALEHFLVRIRYSGVTHGDIPLLRDVVTRVLALERGLRVPFIEGLADLSLHVAGNKWGREQQRFLAGIRWIVQGRKDRRLPGVLVDGGYRPPVRKDFDQLPRALTMALKCSNCGKKDGTIICAGCQVYTIYDGQKYFSVSEPYCSRKCQGEHWAEHSGICKSRTRLRRSVAVMRAFFTAAEFQASNLIPTMCSVRNHVTIVKEESKLLVAMQGDYFVRTFDADKFPTKRAEMMAISNEFARDIFSQIHPLKVWLWSTDWCKRVEELTILVKNVDCPIMRMTPDGTTESTMLRPHPVFRVTLDTGERFAVDIAGGRFGWKEGVVRWDHYEKRRVLHVLSSVESNYADADYSNLPQVNTLPVAVSRFHGMLIEGLLEKMKEPGAESVSPDAIKDALSTRDHKSWDELMGRILDFVKTTCREVDLYHFMSSPGRGWMYVNAKGELRVTLHPAERAKLDDVWLTSEEAKILDAADTEGLKLLWTERLKRHGIEFRDPEPTTAEMLQGITVFANPNPQTEVEAEAQEESAQEESAQDSI